MSRIVEQKDLYVSKVRIADPEMDGGYIEKHVTHHDISNHFNMADSKGINGINYVYDGDTDLWTISGTATAVSTKYLIDSESTLPNYFIPTRYISASKGYQFSTYSISLDERQTGDIVPLKIEFYGSSSKILQTITYPEDKDFTDNASKFPSARTITFPKSLVGIKVYYLVKKGASISSTIAYHIRPEDVIEDVKFTYGNTVQITIDGGNGYKSTGSKNLVFNTVPVTGKCTITSSGAVSFDKPGKSWITVYNKGSTFTKKENGKSISCIYQKSKLLVLEVEWNLRQIIIKVARNQTIQVGGRIPAIDQSNYITEGLLSGDTLYKKPTLFFVYESEDFYKFDVFSQTYSDNRYDEGIKYVKNNDGSWTVSGRIAKNKYSYYNLIVSPRSLPDYFKNGRVFQLTIKEKIGDSYIPVEQTSDRESKVQVSVCWYLANGQVYDSDYNHASIIQVPPETKESGKDILISSPAIGVIIKLKVGYVDSSVDLGSGRTFLFNMIYPKDRYMNTLVAGSYPIGAKDAVAPKNKSGYDQKIQYRSNKGLLKGLVVQNNKKYSIFLDYDSNLGHVQASRYKDYPYTDVTFWVEANIDSTFIPPAESTYYQITSDNRDVGFNFLYDLKDSVTKGDETESGEAVDGGISISATINGVVTKVPFKRVVMEEKSNLGAVRSGEYQFRIPTSNCTISCNYQSIRFDMDSPYRPEDIPATAPYVDIGGPQGSTEYKVEDKYWQGVVFCYWARQKYFEEDIPLMQGTDTAAKKFYNINSFTNKTEYNIYRKDLITVVNRISHALRGRWPVTAYTQKNPDESFYSHAASMNAPQARMFTYAGYPRVPKYEQKWRWVNKEVKIQDEINYCIVTAESGANIRSGPSTTASRIGVYALGTIVQIKSVTESGWAEIYKLGSTTETVYTSNKSLTPISTYEKVTVYEPTKDKVNIRSGPGNGYSNLGYVSQGYAILVTSVKDDWAKLNAVFVPVDKDGNTVMQKVDYSNKSGYVSAKYIQIRTNQEEITKTVKEKVYEYDRFGNPVWSTEYDLDADGNIQYEDISYTRYNGKFPGVPTTSDGKPDGGSTERTIDWAVMNFGNQDSKNPYGANDDYLLNFGNMPNIGWGSYIGVMSGYNEQEFGATSYATYQEAVTVLWRYARFRQFDIMGDGGYYMQIDDSDVAYWAQHGPWRWAISRGIFDGNRMRTTLDGTNPDNLDPVPAKPTDYINRAEWAYMVYRFCTMYAW